MIKIYGNERRVIEIDIGLKTCAETILNAA